MSGWCLRVSSSVRMVSECVRQMSGVGRCHMQCQKHAETARLSENDTQKHQKNVKKHQKCHILLGTPLPFLENCLKWLRYMYIKGFWAELASNRKFKSNRVSGNCGLLDFIFAKQQTNTREKDLEF